MITTRAQASKNKAEAIRLGLTTYMGGPCLRGHEGLRRVKGSDCHQCVLDRVHGCLTPVPPEFVRNKEARLEARRAGQKSYEGRPCVRGHTLRDSKLGHCIICARSKVGHVAYREKLLLKEAEKRSQQHGLPFNLELSDIIIPEVCPIFGIPLIAAVGGVRTDNSPTLDRIDNTKGYVKGNIAVISWGANRLKNNGTAEQHRKIADWMRAHGAA